MPYLIDGNNLLGAGRDRRLGIPTDERELVRKVAAFAGKRRGLITIVFDGPPRSGARPTAPRIRVLYSQKRSADAVIVDAVRSSRAPRDIIVVTSDRDLRSRVRAASGRVMGCRDFAAALAGADADADGDEKPSAEDVAMWERYFAGED